MFIEINLAPDSGNKRRGGRGLQGLSLPRMPAVGGEPRAVLGGVAGLLILAAIGFGIWRQGAREEELQAAIATEMADSTRYATTIELITSLRARQDTITQKIAVIRDVDQRRYVWPHLLDEISASIPAFTWLSQISSTAGADSVNTGPVFTVQGNAGSTQALTRFMKNLEASPMIREVGLVTSQQDTVQGRTVLRFTLEARWEEPDSAFVQTVPLLTSR